MADWRVQQLQAVWFTKPQRSSADLFAELVGARSMQTQTSFLPPPQQGEISISVGSNKGLSFRVSTQPNRVDLLISGQETGAEEGPPLLPDLEPLFELLFAATDRTKGLMGKAVRHSVLVNLVRPQESLDEANKEAIHLTGAPIDPIGISDYILQFNRRRRVDELGFDINRIGRWAVDNFQMVDFNASSVVPVVRNIYFTSFNIDVNTVPTARTFDGEEHVQVIKCLADEVTALAEVKTIETLGGRE